MNLLVAFTCALLLADEPVTDWPQFRGPEGQGIAASSRLPVTWSDRRNIVWKTPILGLGYSSPVVRGDRVWLTTAVADEGRLLVLALDLASGRQLLEVPVFQHDKLWAIHWKNSHASPTPVLADGRCYVHFGSHGTAALDEDGRVLWKQRLLYYHHHGPGSSPVLSGRTLVLICDGLDHSFYDDRVIPEPIAPQFVAGLDADTGDIKWLTRREGRHSYATPLEITVDGKKQVVCPGGSFVAAYDPETGAELWRVRHNGYSLVPRPVFGHGLVFVCTGYDEPTLLAIRPNGSGDVTDSHVAWKSDDAVPLNPSPVLADDALLTLSDNGVLTCYEATTGKVRWKKRVGGSYSASPLLAGQKLYMLNESGTTLVANVGGSYKLLSRNLLDGRTLSSPSAAGHSLLLRTDSHLLRIDGAAGDDDSPDAAADDTKQSSDNDAETSVEPAKESGIRIRGTSKKPNP
jgi:outer membrane protein assembly factor BamB